MGREFVCVCGGGGGGRGGPGINLKKLICCYNKQRQNKKCTGVLGKSTHLSARIRAANEYSSLGVRGGLGLYSSPF